MFSQTQKSAIKKLRGLAKALGFKVRFFATKEMETGVIAGLMMPDLQAIYINPDQDQPVESLAHEIGHVLVFHLGLNSLSYDKEERIADQISIVLCRLIGYSPKQDREDKLSPVVVGGSKCRKR